MLKNSDFGSVCHLDVSGGVVDHAVLRGQLRASVELHHVELGVAVHLGCDENPDSVSPFSSFHALLQSNAKLFYCTCPSHGVGGAEALGLPFLPPGLEELLEHGRLSSLGHHLHAGAGWVALGFDVSLASEQNRGKTWTHLLFCRGLMAEK